MFGKKIILSGLGLLSVLGGSRLIGDDHIVNNQIETHILRAGGFNPGGTTANSFDRSVTFNKQSFNVSQLSDMATINANSYTDGLGEKYFTISKKYIAKEGYLILKFTDDSFYSDSLLLSDSVTHGFKNPDTSSGNCRNTYGIYIYYANGSYHELNANRITDMFGSISEDIGSESGIEVSSTHPCYAIIDLVESKMAYDTDLTLATTISKNPSVTVVRNTALTYPSDLYDGQTKDIFIDVDKGYSKQDILSAVSAKDLFGKECPVSVIAGDTTFNPFNIGVYTLKLQATDTYGQTATATLIVHICDYVEPNIRQIKDLTFTADKNQTLKYSDLSSYFSVTDNGTAHGSTLNVDYTYDGKSIDSNWSKTFVGSDYGSHTIKVHARDASGNEKSGTAVVMVNDGTAPVLSRTDGQEISSKIVIGVSKTFTMTLTDITQLFRANDNIDGDVSDTITGLTDGDKNFFSNNHKVGAYSLTIVASDKTGNKVTQSIPIEFVADIPPVFIVANTLVYTDTANKLSVSDINLVISNAILKDKKLNSLNVDASEYIGNEDKPGIYHVTYTYSESDDSGLKNMRRLKMANGSESMTGALDIIVRDVQDDTIDPNEPTEKEKNFWEHIGLFFVRLGNWIRGVVTKFDFTCFIDNDEWNEKFKEVKPIENVSSEAIEGTNSSN